MQKIGERAFACITQATASSWSKIGSAKQFSFEDTEAHPSQLREIAARAFVDGGASGDLVLPEGLTSIGESAFDGSLGLTSVHLPDSLRSIPNYAFQRSGLCYVEMSDNVESIGVNAFSNSLFLTQIKLTNTAEGAAANGLPSHLTELADGAFSATYIGAEGASDLVVPGTVKHLGQGVFSGDRFITSITLGEGVESIGYLVEKGECGSVFEGCTALESVTLPKSLTNIYANSFNGCSSLKNVSYRGSETDFKKVVIGKGNTELTDKSVNYNAN